ncbi:MAG TPA: PadR family transcriptional regulator [Solirubrobacteraceae bacterium]|jgi:PadR family transcriptional regulator AphA|nr:PadR family transcriptional regulator [Solirubrobacteraceae bacterium]
MPVGSADRDSAQAAMPRLSTASYVVLGMLEYLQPATPYDLKRAAEASKLALWAVPHTQLYTECARLAREGLLAEHREQTGRRRRRYSLAELGSRALDAWRDEPVNETVEPRDLGILKLSFGADPTKLAGDQLRAHEARLRSHEEQYLATAGPGVPRGQRLALESGLRLEREYVHFWKALVDG